MHYEFNEQFVHAVYEMAFDFSWVCAFYFLWEISVIQTRLDPTLSKIDQEHSIFQSITRRNRMMLLLGFYGFLLLFFHIFDALSGLNQDPYFLFL